ncbi:Phosphonates import ATP-binding protein PhnC [Trichinella pseudospiralis]
MQSKKRSLPGSCPHWKTGHPIRSTNSAHCFLFVKFDLRKFLPVLILLLGNAVNAVPLPPRAVIRPLWPVKFAQQTMFARWRMVGLFP